MHDHMTIYQHSGKTTISHGVNVNSHIIQYNFDKNLQKVKILDTTIVCLCTHVKLSGGYRRWQYLVVDYRTVTCSQYLI